MSFIIDKQSLEDLNLLGKYKNNSIYNLFNTTQTIGGEKLLENWFQNPLTDHLKINDRTAILRHFQSLSLHFPFQSEELESAERYLREAVDSNFLLCGLTILRKKIYSSIVRSEEYLELLYGVRAMIQCLQTASRFLDQFYHDVNHPFYLKINKVEQIFQHHQIKQLLEIESKQTPGTGLWEPSLTRLIRYHYLFRNSLQEELQELLDTIYELDIYIAVSQVAHHKNLQYGTALPASARQLKARSLRHPALEKAKSNAIELDQCTNVLFLTGANMAGKSTWMKTIGTSMYLAHLGMPIAADSFEFSIIEGIYSSINVPDNINLGYSHFYAEVLRVKDIAHKVSEGKNLLVLFDELFKGTNVKDAYDATLAVTEAFAAYTNCFFIISTHIIEVGEALSQYCKNVQFRYLPTVMEGTTPKYTYQLTDGITTDRQGMLIIENEKILEIIKGYTKKS